MKNDWVIYCLKNYWVCSQCHIRGPRVAQWWDHSPPTNVARVQIPTSTPYVGWVWCWFSPLFREVFLRVLRFSPLLKNQHFEIPIRPGIRTTMWMCYLQIVVYFIFIFFFYIFLQNEHRVNNNNLGQSSLVKGTSYPNYSLAKYFFI